MTLLKITIAIFCILISLMEINALHQEAQDLDFLNQGSQVLLLRHANSNYNYEFSKMAEHDYTDEQYRNLRIKKDLRDAPLSDLGIQQWTKAQSLANKLKVDFVFVSPLKRALETAYYVFNSHPNFENIQFVLLPMLREAVDTVCDIPVNIIDTIEDYKKKFPKFDSSELEKYQDPAHYFLKDIELEFSNRIMKNKVQDTKDSLGSNAFELLLEEINENYPEKIENNKHILKRVAKAKTYIKEFIESTDIEDDSKIVLVGHSNYFKNWTGKWDRELSYYGDEVPEPTESVFLNNTQFYPDAWFSK